MSSRDRKILTQTQKETLDAVKRYIAVNHESPTLEELATSLRIKLPTLVDRISVLLKKGYLIKADADGEIFA